MTAPSTTQGAYTVPSDATVQAARPEKPSRLPRYALHTFLIATCVVWLTPLVWAIYTSLRPIEDTNQYNYFYRARSLTFDNYTNAFTQADFPRYWWNTFIVVVPSLFLILGLASFVAFAVSRFSWRGNILLLMIFTAGNLLPQQSIITPLFRMYLKIPLPGFMSNSDTLYDSYWGLIVIHTAFQLGFCTFVLSNYMKALPVELTEAAVVDGASVWRQYSQVILPLCKAPLAALATLEFTWIYNDFFWAQVLMRTGDKRPVTSALNNLQGQFFVNNNLIAAGALLTAIPTLVVYFILQRQFVGGLTLGANKG
jgi:multiple sugar transport system permease protein